MAKGSDRYLTQQEQNMSQKELWHVITRCRKENERLTGELVEKDAAIRALQECILEKDKLLMELKNRILESSRIAERMSDEFNRVRQENIELSDESKKLEETNKKLSEELEQAAITVDKLRKTIFGTATEQMGSLQPTDAVQEEIDEATEEEQAQEEQNPANGENHHGHAKRKRGKRPRGKWKLDYSSLPYKVEYAYDEEEFLWYLDHGYPFLGWEEADHLSFREDPVYVRKVRTPVFTKKNEMVSLRSSKALQHSLAGASMAAYVFYMHFALYVPFYRLEMSFQNTGLALSRQTMTNWVSSFAAEYFQDVWNHLYKRILTYGYHQCDETTWKVLMDERPSGSKGYVWAHSLSECLEEDVHPVILFVFELTRGAQHLKDFYPEEKEYVITCDAYGGYKTLERARDGKISLSGCAAHARRKFVESLVQIKVKGMSREEYEALPEGIVLTLFAKIYTQEGALRHLSSAEREEERRQKVRPLMEELDRYLDSIDMEDPKYRTLFKDAVRYWRNQKQEPRRFLEDGKIPIDHLSSERNVKRIALSRKNSLFSFSLHGAEATMIMFSIAATASANGGNVRLYFQYVIEAMTGIPPSDRDEAFMETVMPWSKEYRAYEKKHSQLERPKSPRLHDKPPEGYEGKVLNHPAIGDEE